MSTLDYVQAGLDVAGFLPVVGTFADIGSGFISLGRGDYVGAGLAAFAAIPLIGDIAGAGKGLKTGNKLFKSLNKSQATDLLTKKFGPPRSVREGAATWFNPRTGRSYNIHHASGHMGGAPHVDVRVRGGGAERKFLLGD